MAGHFKKIEEIDKANKQLILKIDDAEKTGSDDYFSLKRELYENKIEMIRLIELRDKRNGMTFDELDDLVENMPSVPRYYTGVKPLDDALDGIETGTFIQLAGESFTGKTKLVTEILTNIAEFNKSVFFSFEMGKKRSRKRISDEISKQSQRKNLIIDFDTRNIDDMCNEIILYANDGVRFFAVDSKMKVEVPDIAEDYRKAAHISARLSKLTQQNDIIIILINQINEDDIKHKRLALKHGGDQKYDADIALFYMNHEEHKDRRIIVCPKNRTGDENTFSIEVTLHNGKTVGVVQNVTYASQTVQYNTPTSDLISMAMV